MRARYGVATDKDGEPLLYDHKQEDFTIKNGFIMASNKSIYDLCNERLKPYLKDL
jgi:hypothetical protein